MLNPDLATAMWFKSSKSGPNCDNCVEVAIVTGAVGVRDSKDRSGSVLEVNPSSWASFVGAVRAGNFGA